MQGVQVLLAISLCTLAFSFAYSSDPSPLQDFCVALKDTQNDGVVFVNGKLCKNPKHAKAEDFFFSGLDVPGNTSNQVGSKGTPVNVEQITGLNTLGVSLCHGSRACNRVIRTHGSPRDSEGDFGLAKETTRLGPIDESALKAYEPTHMGAVRTHHVNGNIPLMISCLC